MGDGWLQEIDGIRLTPSPVRVEGALSPLRRAPPRLGEHQADVLAELG
jgi:crotonobetainyl-CoA:carnitine CoA-transferase CaiB-like acyl-CoA transferase